MIAWSVQIYSGEKEYKLNLSHGDRYEIKETDKLVFQIIMDEAEFTKLGSPSLIIGDIPTEFIMAESSPEGELHFISSEPAYSYKSRYFYNFFGESEASIIFENSDTTLLVVTFDILARKENAYLAEEMLSFLSNNIDDAISICFSRSKNSASLLGEDGNKFSKYDAVMLTVDYLSKTLPTFARDKKANWKQEIIISQNGQPTGPESVYWALTNLDKLSPSTVDDYNIYYNNRGYHFDEQPKEILIDDTNVFENIVINSFLHNAEKFLSKLITHYMEYSEMERGYSESEYVRFDHTMSKYAKMALKLRVKEIKNNHSRIKSLIHKYNRIIKSQISPNLLPRITSFVAKKLHYREAFRLINIANLASSPIFDDTKLLFGLKNLSIVYEITSLIMLHKSLRNVFSVELSLQSFRQHTEMESFGGVAISRPSSAINNHFMFSGELFQIELFYEPKIYPLSNNSRPNDLIDTSNTNASTTYGKHHFCPDFVMKIHSKAWRKSLTIILDAKFKDANSVKQYDIPNLTMRYLMNIHSLSSNYTIVPIDLLIILFAHKKTGSLVKTVSSKHCLNGSHPVLPQVMGTLFIPSENTLDDKLQSLVQHYNNRLG